MTDETTKLTRVFGLNSDNLSVDQPNEPGLYRFTMPDNPDIAAKELAEIMSVIERVREEETALRTTRVTLEGMAERLRLIAAGAVPVTPELQVPEADVSDAPEAEDQEGVAPLRRWRVLSTTVDYADDTGRVIRREILPRGQEPPEPPAMPAPVSVVQQPTPRALGLREGSKKHRIYVATTQLLKKGPRYIDDIMKALPAELFEGITSDRRNNLSNILSQLKTVGLLASDNRGNWSLPTKKAAK
jgi:hypothetical protein